MDASDIVILASDIKAADPRDNSERPRQTTARAVLHCRGPHVLIEVRDADDDAVGQPSWHRVDAGKANATEPEIRAAYAILERLTHDWYSRALEAEKRVVEAEKRTFEAEARATQAERRALSGSRVAPALPGSRVKARQRLSQLLGLANGSSSEDEARNAALAAVRLMKEHGLEPQA